MNVIEMQDKPASGKQTFTALFVRRPILALVFNALMIVAGLAAYAGIEVRELPDVDRPVVTTSSTINARSSGRSLKPRRKAGRPFSFSTKMDFVPSCRATCRATRWR